MNNSETKIKYFLYARRSSEGEDKQVASVQSQIDVLTAMAKQEGFEIIEILSESQSAKAPGRPIFNSLLNRLQTGEAQGIICWKLDRLARNPVDGGSISWMLQQGFIHHIRTYDRNYYPTDNVLMMSVEFGMANQFILDLTSNTKRGLDTKIKKGWFPGSAPIGYINNKFLEKGKKNIIKDPERFDLVKKLWEMFLTEQYSIQALHRVADDWGLTIKNRAKVSRTQFYRIFTNPFYCGYFEYAGEIHKGVHEKMITREQFELGQRIQGIRKPKLTSRSFAYTGLMLCGECNSAITAEWKTKKQKNGNIHHYTYYHCTKRKNSKCLQKCTSQEELEKQIHILLERIEIPPQFHEWAMKQLQVEAEIEEGDRNMILTNQQKSYETSVKKLDSLIEMRMNEEVTQEEFLSKKATLLQEKDRLHELLNDTDGRINQWVQKAETVFSFAKDAKRKFETGDLEEKRHILSALGSNLFLKDKILTISIQKPLLLVEEAAGEVKKIHARLEPLNSEENKANLEEVYSNNLVLGDRPGSNRQPSLPQSDALTN